MRSRAYRHVHLCCVLSVVALVSFTPCCGATSEGNPLRVAKVLPREDLSIRITGISSTVDFYAPLTVEGFEGYISSQGPDYEILLRHGLAFSRIVSFLKEHDFREKNDLTGGVRWRLEIRSGESQIAAFHVSDHGELIENATVFEPADRHWWREVSEAIQRDF